MNYSSYNRLYLRYNIDNIKYKNIIFGSQNSHPV